MTLLREKLSFGIILGSENLNRILSPKTNLGFLTPARKVDSDGMENRGKNGC